MKLDTDEILKKIKKVKDFSRVNFIFLYGSMANGKDNKMSDIDLCVHYDGNKQERFKFRLRILSQLPDSFDVQIFQDIPLYVKKEILKGKLIYAKDTRFVYDVAYQAIKEFEDFKKHYYDYINMRKIEAWKKARV